MRRMVALVVVLAIGLAACGDDKKDDGPTSIQSGTTVPPGITTVPSGEAAKLAPLVLVAADFPSGWATGDPDPDEAAVDDERARCIGTSLRAAALAELEGQSFSQQLNQISSGARILKDDAAYNNDLAALRGSKLSSCLKDQLNKEISKSLEGRTATIDVADLAVRKHGDLAVGRRLTVNASGGNPGETVNVVVDYVILAKARRVVSVALLGFGAPIDEALRVSLIDKVGSRLDAVT